MPKSDAVWGIDLGQCALKAIRCRRDDEDENRIVADAFDYVEYPKLLNQPEAEPDELVRDALKTFLSRNNVRPDQVAISVSGQNGLARFIKLPPVESKKIPDIVKYEARQQIPFPLDEVVWDYQRMPGGSEEEGYTLETEVGLFAMKREQVFRSLRPFQDAGAELDLVQLTPLAIYNFIVYDQFGELPPEAYNPEEPPESLVVISLGTDTTDLVITNGYRVWQRSIPLGGNHFTKALSKELKLTFAQAEHLKRNATKADDPKALFKAMRPVFSDLLTEIQTSIRYFQNVDRKAKIGRVVGMGNAMKLPGLKRYLAQNLGMDVGELDAFRRLTGPEVLGAAAFKENVLSFGVCYGLAVQTLGMGSLSTNLLPREIYTERLVREKKPWALAAVAVLLLGCAINFFGHWRAWASSHEGNYKDGQSAVDNAKRNSDDLKSQAKQSEDKFQEKIEVGNRLIGDIEGRHIWLEMLKALADSLPRSPDPDNPPKLLSQRPNLYITGLDYKRFDDQGRWLRTVVPGTGMTVHRLYLQGSTKAAPKKDKKDGDAEKPEGDKTLEEPLPPETPAEGDGATGEGSAAGGEAVAGPKKPGWVIQLAGHHYYRGNAPENQGLTYVRNTLIKNLENGTVKLPIGPNGKIIDYPIKELGIQFPVVVKSDKIVQVRNPLLPPGTKGAAEIDGVMQPEMVSRFNFTVQFWWGDIPLNERLVKRDDLRRGAAPPPAEGKSAGEEKTGSGTGQ